MMAHAGASGQSNAQSAFDASALSLAAEGLELLAREQISIADLDQAVGKLEQLAPAAKSRILRSICAAYERHLHASRSRQTPPMEACNIGERTLRLSSTACEPETASAAILAATRCSGVFTPPHNWTLRP